MPQIICRDLSFAYEGTVAVSGLHFEVGSGDYLCIVGENGSGKSTLVQGLLGLKSPHGGSILTDGLAPGEIGYLPQQTAVQKDFPASAYEVVLSGRLGARGLLPFYSKKDKALARENIDRLGVGALRNRCYRELSVGQQQRILLARALCAAKKALLLDEPAAGLDPVATQALYRLIETVNRDTGLTVIMVSHDVPSAVRYASHILHLGGTQVFFGPTADYLQTAVGRQYAGKDGRAHD